MALARKSLFPFPPLPIMLQLGVIFCSWLDGDHKLLCRCLTQRSSCWRCRRCGRLDAWDSSCMHHARWIERHGWYRLCLLRNLSLLKSSKHFCPHFGPWRLVWMSHQVLLQQEKLPLLSLVSLLYTTITTSRNPFYFSKIVFFHALEV